MCDLLVAVVEHEKTARTTGEDDFIESIEVFKLIFCLKEVLLLRSLSALYSLTL
eukprot:m.325778 g.325778  ORF g.325778 m.325778 type:complete len:54 (-) comp55564_c2_seq26:171-332(-)